MPAWNGAIKNSHVMHQSVVWLPNSMSNSALFKTYLIYLHAKLKSLLIYVLYQYSNNVQSATYRSLCRATKMSQWFLLYEAIFCNNSFVLTVWRRFLCRKWYVYADRWNKFWTQWQRLGMNNDKFLLEIWLWQMFQDIDAARQTCNGNTVNTTNYRNFLYKKLNFMYGVFNSGRHNKISVNQTFLSMITLLAM